ncbi:MAG TPA: hypothetical protein VK928_13960 [Longimicrobiales bacterium]|nr:hypothetical protein [Longimicrobiales bacterium]
MDSIRKPILLWGPPGCGKSTYLACLCYRPLRLDEDTELRIVPADERTSDYAAQVLRAVEANQPTSSTVGLSDPFHYRMEKWTRGRRGRADRVTHLADLMIVDPSGDIFKRARLQSGLGQRFLELLGDARGLVLLIDPTDPDGARTYWDLFADNIPEISLWFREQPDRKGGVDGRNRITLPLAVTLTKMDLEYDYRDRPRQLLEERLERALPLLDVSFTRYEIFASSARQRVLYAGPTGDVRDSVEPWGLHEPFYWIAMQPVAGLFHRLGWTQ